MDKTLIINGKDYTIQKLSIIGKTISFTFDGKSYSYQIEALKGNQLTLIHENNNLEAIVASHSAPQHIIQNNIDYFIQPKQIISNNNIQHDDHSLISPMPGRIASIHVQEGNTVKKGDTLLTMEAMKLQHPIQAPYDGTVKTIFHKENDQVQAGILLIELIP